ncbi:Gram-negative bacterial tonB protein [Brevundimonas sp. SH203]|uniref:TonB family protein n=1 Tax=Brevundimonas sp. SH203 TaxID=345167 RepID=UPI0009CD5B95|nr:TonB family protein [Brevundimonas sp. SH203]GAW40190.1 Gram-negative bacterial tonB protein [Brevundimonas sp. SH203]
MMRIGLCLALVGLALTAGCAGAVSNAPLSAENTVAAPRNGEVVLECRLASDGGLTACLVVSETPEGQGFGQAALGVAKNAKMKPGGAEGQRVRFAVRFRLSD